MLYEEINNTFISSKNHGFMIIKGFFKIKRGGITVNVIHY